MGGNFKDLDLLCGGVLAQSELVRLTPLCLASAPWPTWTSRLQYMVL